MPPLLPLSLLAALVISASGLQAQEAVTPQQVRIEDLPPPIRLGARAETVRRAWPVLPTVVIVSDEASYLEALAQWTSTARFPVLLDDGTPEAREDIARFVRGFQPERIVHWQVKCEPIASWGKEASERRAAVESVLYRVWSRPLPGERGVVPINSLESLIARWKSIGVPPPGIVIADVNDSAWPAAVALAMGRMQPIAWINTRGTLGGTFAAQEFEDFAEEVEHIARALGLRWREIGDEIDALTVCLSIPAKVQADPSNLLAMTDMLGRFRESKDSEGKAKKPWEERWAWASQISGSEARSAYMAMCSMFISPSSAWLFDGYPDEEPWSKFDATAAGEFFQRGGLNITVDDAPKQDIAQWRERTATGINAGIIAVNSKGMGNEFHLHGGRCRPGDVPHLNTPSMVYFVHSFSASALEARETVAARWLERGAHAYCGSVHEPTLAGFIPTPIIAARLVSTYPWAAAIRMDDGQPWKIAALGDPLLALGPPAPRASRDIDLPLENASGFDEALRASLEARQYSDAITALVLLGRDEHAARLAAALLIEEPAAITASVADAALMPVFRRGDLATFVELYKRLAPEHAASGWRRDALWHMAHPQLVGTRTPELLEILGANLRPDQIGRDASELAMPMSRLLGAGEAVAMLERARSATSNQQERDAIDQAITQMRNRLGRFRN